MIIDLDSHLREGYFMDEVYNLPEPYARFTPQRMGEGRNHNTKWVHSLDPGDPQGRAAHRHPYIYDPKVNWRSGGSRISRKRGSISKSFSPRASTSPRKISAA
jgi:hypothetical protein